MKFDPVTLAIDHADKIGLDIFPITTIKGETHSQEENAIALVGFKSIRDAYQSTYSIKGKIRLFKSGTGDHLVDVGGTIDVLKFFRTVSRGKMNHIKEKHVWLIGIRVEIAFPCP